MKVTATEPWYPTSMGPPTPQQPARPTPTQATSNPLTFDTAYNFSGQNSSIVQEFFPQLVRLVILLFFSKFYQFYNKYLALPKMALKSKITTF